MQKNKSQTYFLNKLWKCKTTLKLMHVICKIKKLIHYQTKFLITTSKYIPIIYFDFKRTEFVLLHKKKVTFYADMKYFYLMTYHFFHKKSKRNYASSIDYETLSSISKITLTILHHAIK